MTRALTRTNFNNSKLIRVLVDLTHVEAVERGSPFADKLAAWVDFSDAITLCAAHTSSTQCTQQGTQSMASGVLSDEFTRVRTSLVQAITMRHSTSGARTRVERPSPKPGMTADHTVDYEPYRRYHLAHQREMELSVRPLRERAREVLRSASPGLRQLADLDTAFDEILSERESKLFSKIPSLLQKRFGLLVREHQQSHGDDHETNNPELWIRPGGWLMRFRTELQTVLLAELDARLQPTLGLMEALHTELNKN
jgi:hypothetical protein